MTRTFRSLLASLSLVALLSFAGTAAASEAQDLVQARRSEVAAQMKAPPSADRDHKVAATLGALFDYDAMAEGSLGKSWGDLKPEQQAEFKGILTQLIQRAIERNVKMTADYDVQLVGEEPSDGSVTVKTKASSKSNPREEPTEINYVMHQTSGGWRSLDIVTEGSSMVAGYRNQFRRILAKDGYDTLIKKMKAKL
jgi:phospholipid transport system substrate-binding protein